MLNSLSGVAADAPHHAVEHATLHLLAARFPNRRLAATAIRWLYHRWGGNDGGVADAVGDASLRLQAGERGLPYSSQLRTNLLAARDRDGGIMFGSAAVRGGWSVCVEPVLVLIARSRAAAALAPKRIRRCRTWKTAVTEIRTLQTGRVASSGDV